MVTVTAHEPVLAVTTPPLPEFPAPQVAAPTPMEQAAQPQVPTVEPRMEEQRVEPPSEQQEPTAREPAYEPLPPVMPPIEPEVEPEVEPKVEPKAELEQSGLVMIETDPSKARPVQAEPEPLHSLGRPRRERRPQQVAAEPELVQIETRK